MVTETRVGWGSFREEVGPELGIEGISAWGIWKCTGILLVVTVMGVLLAFPGVEVPAAKCCRAWRTVPPRGLQCFC